MIVHIWKDEAWPVYGIDKDRKYDTVEIPDTLYVEYQYIMKLYRALQEELAKYYEVHS